MGGMLHGVWTLHEILLQKHNLAPKENGLITGESVIPQSVTRDPFAGDAENPLT